MFIWKRIELLVFFCAFFDAWGAQSKSIIVTPHDFAVQKLKKAEVSSAMIALIEREFEAKERARIIELNLFGFFGKADYSGHYSKRAVRKCTEFLKKNARVLKQVEQSTGVSKEVIAALLWVETKHGKLTGHNSVNSVFFSLLQADHPEILNTTLDALEKLVPKDDPKLKEYQEKVRQRSVTKSNWALGEVKALDQMLKKNPFLVKRLKGSFAGAFGYPQFIPSSYLQWARGSKKGVSPNLFKMEDAIQSVGFYLKANGWLKANPGAQREALYHYNRAYGYGEVILKLAEGIK